MSFVLARNLPIGKVEASIAMTCATGVFDIVLVGEKLGHSSSTYRLPIIHVDSNFERHCETANGPLCNRCRCDHIEDGTTESETFLYIG